MTDDRMSLVAEAELESVKKQVAQQQEYIQVHAVVVVLVVVLNYDQESLPVSEVNHVPIVAIWHELLKKFLSMVIGCVVRTAGISLISLSK